MRQLIGRKSEEGILKNALESNRSELIVVYGRRRIGKTFLIREVYKKHIKFEFSGIHRAKLKIQLKNFYLSLSAKNSKVQKSTDWLEAFHELGLYFDKVKSKKKKVLFIDEFPWLDTRRSNFLGAFDSFWNNYASRRDDMVVVICGSAASYMINKIVKNKGGLHNRLTEKIKLEPFSLFETEQLLKAKKVKLSRYNITQLYMAMGGVPHYLEKVLPGESVPQILDRLCFKKDGFLRSEFSNVFASLFDNYENHEKIIRLLASVRKGLTRTEILDKSGLNSGGRLTKTLTELDESGFIEKHTPYQGNIDSLYRLTDEYSMFYIKYIEKTKPSKTGIWMKMQGLQSYKTWSGFSFETICMKHIEEIKEGLKISGIHATHGSWIEKNTDTGAQIDLLIDRDDDVINLCEMKFYNTKFTLNKKYANDIVQKLNTFANSSKTKKSIFVTFITSYGLNENQHSTEYVQNELTLNGLFTAL